MLSNTPIQKNIKLNAPTLIIEVFDGVRKVYKKDAPKTDDNISFVEQPYEIRSEGHPSVQSLLKHFHLKDVLPAGSYSVPVKLYKFTTKNDRGYDETRIGMAPLFSNIEKV